MYGGGTPSMRTNHWLSLAPSLSSLPPPLSLSLCLSLDAMLYTFGGTWKYQYYTTALPDLRFSSRGVALTGATRLRQAPMARAAIGLGVDPRHVLFPCRVVSPEVPAFLNADSQSRWHDGSGLSCGVVKTVARICVASHHATSSATSAGTSCPARVYVRQTVMTAPLTLCALPQPNKTGRYLCQIFQFSVKFVKEHMAPRHLNVMFQTCCFAGVHGRTVPQDSISYSSRPPPPQTVKTRLTPHPPPPSGLLAEEHRRLPACPSSGRVSALLGLLLNHHFCGSNPIENVVRSLVRAAGRVNMGVTVLVELYFHVLSCCGVCAGLLLCIAMF